MMILHSIGYTSGQLSRKLWLENFLVCVCGFLSGILFTTAVVGVVNLLFMQPHGKILEVMNLRGLIAAGAIPVFVSVFSIMPSLKRTRNF